jgi:Flp pilus assembly protein TadG
MLHRLTEKNSDKVPSCVDIRINAHPVSKNRTGRPIDQRLGKKRACQGQSLIETLLGFIIIVPLGLASLDLTAVIVANHLNEHLADVAARAAANQIDSEQAKKTVEDIIDNFTITPPINDVNLDNISYDLAKEQVIVVTSVNVNLPIPFGQNRTVILRANSAQPIVATPAAM